jgi:hypothetical protein
MYIGMRHAVVRLSPRGAGYDETWLVPPRCRILAWRDESSCVCAAPDE